MGVRAFASRRGPTYDGFHHAPLPHPRLSTPPLAPYRGSHPPLPHPTARDHAHVGPNFSFKEAILTLSFFHPTPPPPHRLRPSYPSLPLHPPKFLLNPTLKDRCFRCFEHGHRAADCREPHRCLLCMKAGHPAARCPSPRATHRFTMEPGPSSGRPLSVAAFLPSHPPPAGQPSLSGCMARVDTHGLRPDVIKDVLPRRLASRFRRTSRDFKLATFLPSTMAIFFSNWVIREAAIGRSPLRFEGTEFQISNWVKIGELGRRHLQHKAWIHLHH